MNKEEAQKLINQIMEEVVVEEDRIMEEAKVNGTWKMGLDSNNKLFADVNKQAMNKINEIISMIDE